MDLSAAFKTDPAAEQKGVWIEMGDVEFLLGRNGNRIYTDMFAQRYQAHKFTLDQRDTPEQREAANALGEKIEIEVMTASILLGWRGRQLKDELTGEDKVGKLVFEGEDITDKYSKGLASKLLGMKDFRQWVNSKSGDFKNFLAATQKADEKNSANT